MQQQTDVLGGRVQVTERQNPGSGRWPDPEEREKGMVCWSADLRTSIKLDADGIIID